MSDRGLKYEYDLRGRLVETYESYAGSKGDKGAKWA